MEKTKVKNYIIIFLFFVIMATACLLFIPQPVSAANESFNVNLTQEYNESSPKFTANEQPYKSYDGHITFVGYRAGGDDITDWAKGYISGLNARLYGTPNDVKLDFTIYKTSKTDAIDSGYFGSGRVDIIFNGSSKVGADGNCKMSETGNKTSNNLSLGSLEFNKTYTIKVQIRYGFVHSFMGIVGSWGHYDGVWEYKFSLNEINGYNLQMPTAKTYNNNGIYYYGANGFAPSWTETATSYKTNATNNMSSPDVINIQTAATLTDNSRGILSGGNITTEGRHELVLKNKSGSSIETRTAIIDKTAPALAVQGVSAGTKPVYGKNTTISYSYNSNNEAPITTAKYTRKNLTISASGFTVGSVAESDVSFLSSSQSATLTKTGVYDITLTDLVGNTSTETVVVVAEASISNLSYLQTKGYFKTDNYKVKIPYLKTVTVPATGKDGTQQKYCGSYSNADTFVFATYENALEFACEIEMQESVVVAGNNTFRYKQRNNSNATATYTSVAALREVIEFYASRYVSDYGEVNISGNVYTDATVKVLDDAVYLPNTKGSDIAFISSQYSFVSSELTLTQGQSTYRYSSLSNLKIVDDKGTTLFNGKYIVGRTFGDYINNCAGLMTITETDSVGNTSTYQVYCDKAAPSIIANYEYYELYTDSFGNRQSSVVSKSITLTTGYEIDANLKSFEIIGLEDLHDSIVTARVEEPRGNITITHDLSILKFGIEGYFEGGGEYRVKVYDRSLNVFEYVFSIVGAEPKLTSYVKGTGDNKTLNLEFSNGSNYTSITHFTIYRYGVALPENGLYEEKIDGQILNSMTISQNVWNYSFVLGGIYSVRFVDSFNRVVVSEDIVFTKNLPAYTLTGVSENGKTNKAVSLTVKTTVGYELKHNGEVVTGYDGITTDGYRIDIPASIENNGTWEVKLYNKTDVNNYLVVKFTIDTIPPIARATDENGNNVIWNTTIKSSFKVLWDAAENVDRVRYAVDGGYAKTYSQGTLLYDDGVYEFTVTDDVGNKTVYQVELDTTVKYSVTWQGASYVDEGITFVKQGFTLIAEENLSLSILRNEQAIYGDFNYLFVNEGNYAITLTDNIGNTVAFTLVIDKTAPTLEIQPGDSPYSPVVVKINSSDIATYKITYNAKVIPVELNDEMIFNDWGNYTVMVADRLGNQITETFAIQKIPPSITISDATGNLLENGSTTNKGVYFTWDDKNATGRISVSGQVARSYAMNTLINEEGVYTITITDAANNKITATVTIVKTIKFSFVSADGNILDTIMDAGTEKTATPFTIRFDGELQVDVKKDNEQFNFVAGQQITTDGTYWFRIYDSLGNEETRIILFDSTAPTITVIAGAGTHEPVRVTIAGDDIATVRVRHTWTKTETTTLFHEESYEFDLWGEYTIEVFDVVGNSSQAAFTITKLPPTVTIITTTGRALKNGEKSNEPFFIVCNEDDVIIRYKADNGYSQIYKNDSIITEQGIYTITATDVANNIVMYEITLDSSIKFTAVVDGATIRDFTNLVIGKRYIEITVGEPLEIRHYFNDNDDEPLTDMVIKLEEEGRHCLVMKDNAGNVLTIYFELDRTPPKIEIDADTLTANDVILTVADLNDISTYKVQKDGLSIQRYVLQTTNLFTDTGNYTITVEDELGNKNIIEFAIKRGIDYRLSVLDGFVADGNVSLRLRESNITIMATLNGEPYEFELADNTIVFTQTGLYVINMADAIGNVERATFTIDTARYKKSFSFELPRDCEYRLTNNGVEVDIDGLITGDTLNVSTDGDYVLTVKRNGIISNFTFVIDTTMPALVLNGREIAAGEEVGTLREDFILSANKKKYTLTLKYNGNEIEYTAGTSISASGHYEVIITDEVGNVVKYEFDRAFTLNAGAIVLIVVIILAIAFVAVLIVRRRLKMKIT